jgi:hypothetical protein
MGKPWIEHGSTEPQSVILTIIPFTLSIDFFNYINYIDYIHYICYIYPIYFRSIWFRLIFDLFLSSSFLWYLVSLSCLLFPIFKNYFLLILCSIENLKVYAILFPAKPRLPAIHSLSLLLGAKFNVNTQILNISRFKNRENNSISFFHLEYKFERNQRSLDQIESNQIKSNIISKWFISKTEIYQNITRYPNRPHKHPNFKFSLIGYFLVLKILNKLIIQHSTKGAK